jgi:hypothetical protein
VAAAEESIYRVPFSQVDWTAKSGGGLLPSGRRVETVRVLSFADRPSTMIYSQGQAMFPLWSIPLGAEGDAASEMLQLTRDASIEGTLAGTRARLSRNGRWLVFSSHLDGPGRRILVRDLEKGTERAISAPHSHGYHPVITGDAQRVAWSEKKDGKPAILMASIEGGERQLICDDCGVPRDWSPDGRTILYSKGPQLWSLDMAEGLRKPLLDREGYEVQHAGFSPDGQWLAMVVSVSGKSKQQGILVRFGADLADQGRWITLVDEDYHLSLDWAAEEDLVYYFSRRDDFRCLYSQRLRSADKKPIGPPIVVRHFHSHQRYPDGGSWIIAARDKLVVTLRSPQANIYELQLPNNQ